MSAEAKQLIVGDVCSALDGAQGPRLAIAAAWCVVAMEGENQRAEHTEMQRVEPLYPTRCGRKQLFVSGDDQ